MHAVVPLIARVAKPAFGIVRLWRIALEIGARQIIEQHVEGDVEEVTPPIRQVIEHRALVLEQPVMTPIERVNIAQRRIRTEQIRQGAALIPLPMEPPLAARREQSVGHKHEQHLIPARALAARQQPLRPELIQPQLSPQPKCQPTPTPLPGPAQPQLTKPQPHHRLIRHDPFTSIFGE